MRFLAIFLWFLVFSKAFCVDPGVDVFFNEGFVKELKGLRVAVLTNQSGVDKNLTPTAERFKREAKDFTVMAFFTPEHGLNGSYYAGSKVEDGKDKEGIPVYSLHGNLRRPTAEMLSCIDVIVYDIQSIGNRPYTYISTLCYVMEEAAKRNIKVIILDRPNPLGGLIVDGPMLDPAIRSFIGYINIPYCHGMTIGEIARFFNAEYKVGCNLQVIPMRGWERRMSFGDTGLAWVPPSPNIPESDTPFFCLSTGLIGELSLVNIGIGYTQPFKLVGAPWIDAEAFALALNRQKLPGVHFLPYHFRPFYGLYQGEDCHGIKIIIANKKVYRPASVQFLIMGMLKSLYPREVKERLTQNSASIDLFIKACGTAKILQIWQSERYPAWKLLRVDAAERAAFMMKRQKYLIPEYAGNN